MQQWPCSARQASEPDYTALGADVEGRLVGWICWGPTPCTLGTYDLYWMAVDPVGQHVGVGSALLAGDGKAARRTGAAHRWLRPRDEQTTRIPAASIQARGYLETARIPDFYAPGDDLVVCTKRLVEV
jgi:GNAT superfamily N-acetyltransferase